LIKIASWNVNSLKVRLEQVLDWLDESQTDILGIQETKLEDQAFPRAVFEDAGFEVLYRGQKTYNGVAWISRFPIEDPVDALPGFADEQKRVLAATISGIRCINFYVPNGQAPGTAKYEYKLAWLDAMLDFIRQEREKHQRLVILGDFNIAPEDLDVHDPKVWEGQVLVSPEERLAFQKLMRLGFQDSLRLLHPESTIYSWWDYRAAAFRRGMGLRIDHILVSSSLASHAKAASVDLGPRRHERPSDHAPVWLSLDC
jgi:exodeoxyribonuclease-3